MAPTAASSPPLLANFVERLRELSLRGPEWSRALRHSGRRRFEQLGLPTTRDEQWRSTSLTPLAATEFVPAADPVDPRPDWTLPALARLEFGGPRLVFVDGRHAPALSTTEPAAPGLWAGSLRRALDEIPDRVGPYLVRRDPARAQAFDALNAALHEDGAVVLADAGAHQAPPVHLVFVASGGRPAIAVHPWNVVAAGGGARLRVVETYVGPPDAVYLTNVVTDLFADDRAEIDHHRVQLESPGAFHLSGVHGRQTRGSRCVLHQYDLGGRLVRHDVGAVLDGEESDCRLEGLYLTDGEQHVDNHTVLDHARPRGTSRELYKGILAGSSRAVFRGRIVVRPHAQQTDARQSNRNLLLSAAALAHTRPQLEIYADDVKCTHGATVGRLDEDAVFYLRSRGIGEVDARNLMIAAFAGEVLERVAIDSLRRELERTFSARLSRSGDRGDR